MAQIKRILVTGSEGYIGSTLVPLLLQKEYQVDGLDTTFFSNRLDNKQKPNYTLLKKDIRDTDSLDLSTYDAIIHLAALSNDPMGALNPNLTKEINENASIRLANKAKEQGVKRFLFSSSCSIYGIGVEETVNENSEVNPLTAYAQSKIAVENYLKSISDSNFCVGLLRNSTVYGYSPVFRDDLVVNNFAISAFTTSTVHIMSDGTPWRPLIDVRDLSAIFIAFLEAEEKTVNNEIYNIGFNENNFQVKQVADHIKNTLPECTIAYTGEHGKDSRSYKVSFDKFHTAFPFITQQWQLDKSISDLMLHLRNGQVTKEAISTGTYTRLKVLTKHLDIKELDQNLYWIK